MGGEVGMLLKDEETATRTDSSVALLWRQLLRDNRFKRSGYLIIVIKD